MKLVNETKQGCTFTVWGHNDRGVAYWSSHIASDGHEVIDPPHDKKWDIQVIPGGCPDVWSYDVAHDVEATAWPNFKHDTNSSIYNAVT